MAEKFILLDDAERQLLNERYSDLKFLDDIDDYKCVRCNRIAITHYFTNCGHLLCLNCKRIIDNGGFKCKLCKALITEASEQRVEFEMQLLSLRSKCPNTKYGCQLTTNLTQIPEHIKSCEFTQEAALPALLRNKDTTQMMKENLKLLTEEMEVMKAEASQKSIEMQANFNSQIETQKKIHNDELQKLVTKVNNLESQLNKIPLKMVTLDYELDGLQNAQLESDTELENAMLESRKLGYQNTSETQRILNILLFGQVGVGKSTFINALVCYLNYKSLEEAKSADLNCVIPCSFILPNANYEERVITYGNENDGNENTTNTIESSTQKCKSYLFELDEFILRIIDTPGIGHTRGLDQDKLNMENILDYISPLKHLHGICILLRPNEWRLTASFEYCIKQLLCHLHKNASKNIIFVFTNSRGSFFKPGDSIVLLSEVINKLKKNSIEIPLSKNNIVCVDNEAFRYLIALKNNFKFEKKQFHNFNKSWKKSVRECWRMIDLIIDKGRIAHETAETLTLNQVKDMILTQSKAIPDISKLIQQNYDRLNNHLNELRKYTEDGEDLESQLYVPKIIPKIEEFEEPRTICTSEKCRKIADTDGIMQYDYPTICHSPCYLKNVPRNTDVLEELKRCCVFGGGDNCKKCSCSYLEHRHIYYTIQLVYEKDKSTKPKLDAANGFKEKIDIIAKACEERRQKLKEEEDLIIQNLAKLAIFFTQNAFLPYNDAFSSYLKILIDNEESLKADGANNDSVFEGLKNMAERYIKEKDLIEKAYYSIDERISVKEAKRLIENFFSLEFSGDILKLFLRSRIKARANEVKQEEIKVPTKIRSCPLQ